MYPAIMRIIEADSSNQYLCNDHSRFDEIFASGQGPLIRRKEASSPNEVIQNISRLESLTGKFNDVLDLYDPNIIATALLKQEPIGRNINETWYLGDLCDDPEGYYYILRLNRFEGLWLLTYFDPYEKSPLVNYSSVRIGVEMKVIKCHPELYIRSTKVLGLNSVPEPTSNKGTENPTATP